MADGGRRLKGKETQGEGEAGIGGYMKRRDQRFQEEAGKWLNVCGSDHFGMLFCSVLFCSLYCFIQCLAYSLS